MTSLLGKKTVFALVIGLFLAVNIGSVFAAGGMAGDGAMHDCPYMSVPALCTMSPLEHLSQWQQMFAAVAQQLSSAASLLLLALATFWYFLQDSTLLKRMGIVGLPYRDKGKFFDPLRLAFARGILHSKAH
jgi:hypothetical protein